MRTKSVTLSAFSFDIPHKFNYSLIGFLLCKLFVFHIFIYGFLQFFFVLRFAHAIITQVQLNVLPIMKGVITVR